MNCDIIRDLIPLYIDGCCSEESMAAVEEHVKSCRECNKLYEEMKSPSNIVVNSEVPKKFSKLNDWKASVLQSVLLFISFGLITIGVALEARTPSGLLNGFWALNLVVPATGFMLSLANWYFVRVYKSRNSFSNCSCLFTVCITLCAYIWSCFNYEINIFDLSPLRIYFCGIGILLVVLFLVLSNVLSNQYAKMLGKE